MSAVLVIAFLAFTSVFVVVFAVLAVALLRSGHLRLGAEGARQDDVRRGSRRLRGPRRTSASEAPRE